MINAMTSPIETNNVVERLRADADFLDLIPGIHPSRAARVRDAADEIERLRSERQSLSDRIDVLEGENAELQERCEIIKIRVDQKQRLVPRHTTGFRILALARQDLSYLLAREIMGGAQAEDIPDLFMPITVTEGESFVTFPVPRYS